MAFRALSSGTEATAGRRPGLQHLRQARGTGHEWVTVGQEYQGLGYSGAWHDQEITGLASALIVKYRRPLDTRM